MGTTQNLNHGHPDAGSLPTGVNLLHDPSLNKGTAFTQAERDALSLQGLLPPHVHTIEEQVTRVMENFHRKSSRLEQYISILDLKSRNQTLFFKVVVDHLEEMMPIIYTPTVGEACQQFGHIFNAPAGIVRVGQRPGPHGGCAAQLAASGCTGHRGHRR